MQHKQIHQRRVAVYQWFSQLLFRELDEKQLANLENDDNQAWIVLLTAVPGVSVEVKRSERSLGRVLRHDFRQLELAADFAPLFLLALPASVSPYTGHYPHTTAAEERRQMNMLLIEQSLAARGNRPPDRTTMQLALMARMVAKEERLSAQYYFLHHYILCWTPLLHDTCLMRDNEGFYPQTMNLVVRFMREDEQYLKSLLMDDFYFNDQR